MENMSLADVAAVTRNNDGFLEGNGIIILILFFLIFGFGNGGWGSNQISNAVTQSELQRGFDTQTLMGKLDTMSSAQYSNSYENAQLVNNLNTNILQGFAGTNQAMNAGFNSVNATLNTGFDMMTQNMNNLAHQLDQCCCSLKTQMLQDKYDAAQNQLNLAEMASANAVQTQNILNALGTYYPNAPITGCGCGA